MAAPTSKNKLTPPRVDGLDASRKLAGRNHRRTRAKQRVTSSVLIAVAIGVVVAVGFVGYAVYDQQRADELVENEQRQAELRAEREGRTAEDIMVELDGNPRWNGPGAPAFGVGEDEIGIEITDGNVGDD